MTAEDVIALLRAWRERYYGDLDTYEGGERHMTQLDHGHEEYEARMDLVAALEAFDAENVEAVDKSFIDPIGPWSSVKR